MSALGDCLKALDEVLDDHGLRWFVFGAQAVCVRGAPRATQDVDVTVEVEPNRVRPLRDDLASCGFVERFPEQAEHLLAAGRVLTLAHSSGMELDIILSASTPVFGEFRARRGMAFVPPRDGLVLFAVQVPWIPGSNDG